MKYIPLIRENIKHWQVFEYDEQLKGFLQEIDDFENLEYEGE